MAKGCGVKLLGHPPKVIRLTMGNCSNQQVVDTLVRLSEDLKSLLSQPDVGLVEVA